MNLLRPKIRVAIAAIASSSHFAQARTLAAGLAAAAPRTPRTLLWVDGTEPRRAAASRATGFGTIVLPDELVGSDALAALRARYTLPELCFALKPLLLGRLLDDGHAGAIYLDTDMRLYGPLDPVQDVLRRHPIVLTPHITVPLPEDDRLPRDMTILRAGAFNLGIVAVANDPQARRFLEWWGAREGRYGYSNPWRGWGADQKWCDLVPALFPGVGILRHPGVNVGYWNLPSRPLAKEGDRWRVAGEPLVLFHFSGFDPMQPGVLSKFQDRIDPAADASLGELLADYAQELGASAAAIAGFVPPPPPAAQAPDADVAAGVGEPLPPGNYAVRLQASPAVVCAEPGEVVVLRVEVANPGPQPLWIAPHPDGVRGIGLTYHLRLAAGGVLAWDNPRQYRAQPVPPGESGHLDFRFRVPDDPGHFVVEFDLVHEGVAWFGERGATGAEVEIFAGVHRGAK